MRCQDQQYLQTRFVSDLMTQAEKTFYLMYYANPFKKNIKTSIVCISRGNIRQYSFARSVFALKPKNAARAF